VSAVNLAPMEYQLLVDDKKGNVFELSATSLTWKTQRTGRAGSLEFTFLGGDKFSVQSDFELSCGDMIRLEVNGDVIFYGYLFSVESNDGETFSATAYDQLRYLMYNDTYVFVGKTATEIIKQIAGDFKITLGPVTDTKYAIPKLSFDNEKLLDMITEALSETTYNMKKTYVLYDDAGKLTLSNIEDMRLSIALGDYSMLSGYTYKESIDDDTYNRIKLVRDNKESGGRDVYIYQDSANIAKWGVLQYFEIVDEGYNAAMVSARGETLAGLKNRLGKSFKLSSMGDVSCRAGKAVYIEISDLSVKQFFLIEDATHRFEGNDYTMDLTLKVVD